MKVGTLRFMLCIYMVKYYAAIKNDHSEASCTVGKKLFFLTSAWTEHMKTAFALSPGPDNTQFSEFSHDAQRGPSPGLR